MKKKNSNNNKPRVSVDYARVTCIRIQYTYIYTGIYE